MLGQLVRRARLERGLTQRQLAGGHVTQAFVSLIESDKVAPSVETLRIIADRLNKPVTYFIADDSVSRSIDSLIAVANRLGARELFDAAEDIFQEALALCQASTDPMWLARVSMGLANVLRSQCKYQQAIDSYDAALKSRELSDTSALDCYLYISLSYYALCDFRMSRRWLESGLLELKAAADQRRTEFEVHLGIVYYQLGDITKALSYFDDVRRTASVPADRAKAIAGLGMCENELGDVAQSIGHLSQAIDTCRSAAQRRAAMVYQQYLARVLVGAGDVIAARSFLEDCRQYFTDCQEYEWLASTMEAQARICYLHYRYADGVALCEQALSVAPRPSVVRGRLLRLKGCGMLHLGRTEIGRSFIDHGSDLLHAMGALRALKQKSA